MDHIDDKDIKILWALHDNSRLSIKQISKKTNIPMTTVHHRIKRLEKSGVIQNYTIKVDHSKIGKPITAYILVTLDYNALKEKHLTQMDIINRLKKFDVVEEGASITGEFDIIVLIRVRDIADMDNFVIERLRNMDGIDMTRTMVVLKEFMK